MVKAALREAEVSPRGTYPKLLGQVQGRTDTVQFHSGLQGLGRTAVPHTPRGATHCIKATLPLALLKDSAALLKRPSKKKSFRAMITESPDNVMSQSQVHEHATLGRVYRTEQSTPGSVSLPRVVDLQCDPRGGAPEGLRGTSTRGPKGPRLGRAHKGAGGPSGTRNTQSVR